MRVNLYLGVRGVPDTLVEPVSTGLETDDRGIMVFTMPVGDPVTEALGTTDLKAFNPEGRIPVLLLPDGRKMTQSGPIIDFIEDHMEDDRGALLPEIRGPGPTPSGSCGSSPPIPSLIRTFPL